MSKDDQDTVLPPAQPRAPLDYERRQTAPAKPRKWRGVEGLVLSLASLPPVLLALLAVGGGKYMDPFAPIIAIPLWIISLLLGTGGGVAVLSSSKERAIRWADLQKWAILANLVFWCLLLVSLMLFISRFR